MKSRYLKPTFKSGRTTVGISGAITWGRKGPVHFLIKQGRMTSEIYVNQVLEPLGLPFFEEMIEERGYMIWMDDGAAYHTSKFTPSFVEKRVHYASFGPHNSPTSTPSKTSGASSKFGSVIAVNESAPLKR